MEITSLDLMFLAKELNSLANGFFRKIYQYGGPKSRQFFLEIYSPGKGASWLYFDRSVMFVTRKKIWSSQEPPSFCMFLRKHLMGKRIRSIRQHGFDRIIEIVTDDHILIIEIFSKGNVILCDSSYNIVMPLEIQRWKDRSIIPKEKYLYPPQGLNPFELELPAFRRLLLKSDRKLVVFLSVGLGLGSLYAKEVCKRAGVEEEKNSNTVTTGEVVRLHETMASLPEHFKPVTYQDAVSPFPLETKKGSHFKMHKTLIEALDEFFSGRVVMAHPEEKAKIIKVHAKTETKPAEYMEKEVKERKERIIKQHEDAREKWAKKYTESKEAADTIYNNYSSVETILEGINKARMLGLSWKEIKAKISVEDSDAAGMVKEIREGDGIVMIELEGKEIALDLRKNSKENAALYYDESKKARKKLQNTISSMKEQEVMEKPVQETSGKEKPKKKRGHWYDKFKHFFSSADMLVVAGRSATQNENLIKKKLEANDLVYHADIPGAAFVVVKSKGNEIIPETRKEAAEFAAVNSKAWTKGLGKIDVFEVTPDQVSKSPPSGQYLQKGSFMIRGERVWHRDIELKLSIGVKMEEGEAKIVYGPVFAVRKNSDYFVTIRPGYKKSMELSKLIKNKILAKARPEHRPMIESIPLSDFQDTIPGGMGDIVLYG